MKTGHVGAGKNEFGFRRSSQINSYIGCPIEAKSLNDETCKIQTFVLKNKTLVFLKRACIIQIQQKSVEIALNSNNYMLSYLTQLSMFRCIVSLVSTMSQTEARSQ